MAEPWTTEDRLKNFQVALVDCWYLVRASTNMDPWQDKFVDGLFPNLCERSEGAPKCVCNVHP